MYWEDKLRRFQVHNSVICHLSTASCAHQPKSNHLLSPCMWPLIFTLYLLPTPSLPVITILLWVFLCLVCSFVTFSFISHISEITWFLTFFCLTYFARKVFHAQLHMVKDAPATSTFQHQIRTWREPFWPASSLSPSVPARQVTLIEANSNLYFSFTTLAKYHLNDDFYIYREIFLLTPTAHTDYGSHVCLHHHLSHNRYHINMF